ncbi:hypothetical protein J1N35_012617 [Gossypium stocksii]|uniref:F-box domain-containing protein n=1 Tax=Gossypium stocksii TaxID=47602 RepID=A0A9D3W488_9ROSI|nr:hypothetical protein J1N35_012617 [Gossypium stocksii]
MATLSHDMIIEILGCLSVKDLLHFKCVSKLWCFWIEDPYFINFHLSHSLKTSTNHSLILRPMKFQFLSVNYDSPKTTRRLKQPFECHRLDHGVENINVRVALGMNSEYGVGIGGEAQRRTCFVELAEKKLVVMEGCSNHESMSRLNLFKVRAMLYVKDILRFKCVSKFWCSWIEDPYFIRLHLSYSLKTNTNRSLIVRHCKYQFLSVNYDSPKITRRLKQPLGEQKKYIQILGSCNGLLAVEDENGRILLWNPSTRKYQVLPSTEIEFSSPPIRYSRSTYYGFGYDPVSDDYKVVRIVQLLGANDEYFHSEVKVYSLRSNFWRRIKDFCFYFISNRQLGFLANNVLHLLAFKTPESSNRNLVGFDLRSEEFSLVDLPDFCLDENIYFDVKAMEGYLCLTATYLELGDIVADVWIMKEYGVKESWVKLVSSNYPDLIPGFPSEVPLAFSKNGDKVLFHLKFNGDKRDSLVWYDLGSKRIEKVGIRGVPIVYDVDLYVESLVPLNHKPPRVRKKRTSTSKKLFRSERDNTISLPLADTNFHGHTSLNAATPKQNIHHRYP